MDLEYDVQIFQVIAGQNDPKLRTPRIHLALKALSEAGVLGQAEGEELAQAYAFLRVLINALRMLRGSAQDFFLPPPGSDEYLHLARRMAYEPKDGLEPDQQLRLEFEIRTAAVRAFVERHFGRESLPGPAVGNVADLILSEQVPAELRERILAPVGFRHAERACVNLNALAQYAGDRNLFARLAVLACDQLKRTPDPDMALNNWERFMSVLEHPAGQFRQLLAQPMRLEIMLGIFAGSQFLADALARNPEFFNWATNPENVRGIRQRAELDHELRRLAREYPGERDWQNALRRLRRREILRIGTRDLCLKASLTDITLDLSTLADAWIQAALDQAWERARVLHKIRADHPGKHFCILALGKLGGRELNYSSDIDLLGVYNDPAPEAREGFAWAMDRVGVLLSQYTEEGRAYRVDLRLRPYGGEGEPVYSVSSLLRYYRAGGVSRDPGSAQVAPGGGQSGNGRNPDGIRPRYPAATPSPQRHRGVG